MTPPPGSDDRAAEVLRLAYIDGLGVRAIAKRLSMSRRTVRRLLGRKPLPPRKAPDPRTSLLDPYLPVVHKLVEETPELKAPAVLERLRPLGYKGGITILRDRLRTIRPGQRREAFLTLQFSPGQAVQVDWADFGFAIPGCPRRVSGFVMALAYSRYLYLEFTLSQSMGSFLRCMERGLAFFGGTTTADVFDNMKTVVLDPRLRIFNPRFLHYAGCRGFAAIACNPGKGNEKGRVERPIGFIRDRFWTGRRFADLLDLNVQGTSWRDDFANNRVHEVTGKVPALVFEHEEQRVLKPIPPVPIDTDDILSTGVTKSYRVTFDRNRYSVPSRLVGQSVLVRGTSDQVAVFLGPKQVALHRRFWGIGEDIKHESHDDGVLAQKPRAGASQLPPGLAGLGEAGARYLKVFAAGNRSIHREIARLTLLAELFGEVATASAMHDVMATGHVGAEYVEYVMRHRKGLRPSPAPLRLGRPDLDGLTFREPDLSAYDRLIPAAMTRDPGEPPTDGSSA
jgi:transposase